MKNQELIYKSKLVSAESLGLKLNKYFKDNSTILYLGASSGTTISYISQEYKQSEIYAIDLAPLMLKQIVLDVLLKKLTNVIPILADANKPLEYKEKIQISVDIIYQDVAQKNQLEIFDKNVDLFLAKDGFGFIAIKSRSIDTTKNPKLIFKKVESHLSKKYNILEQIDISKYQKDHMFYVVQPKK